MKTPPACLVRSSSSNDIQIARRDTPYRIPATIHQTLKNSSWRLLSSTLLSLLHAPLLILAIHNTNSSYEAPKRLLPAPLPARLEQRFKRRPLRRHSLHTTARLRRDLCQRQRRQRTAVLQYHWRVQDCQTGEDVNQSSQVVGELRQKVRRRVEPDEQELNVPKGGVQGGYVGNVRLRVFADAVERGLAELDGAVLEALEGSRGGERV
jgi:hypothetical protein